MGVIDPSELETANKYRSWAGTKAAAGSGSFYAGCATGGGYNVQQPRKPLPGENRDIVNIGNMSIRKADRVIIISGEEIGNLDDIPKAVKKLKRKLSKLLLKG